jgi:hypothetical protein
MTLFKKPTPISPLMGEGKGGGEIENDLTPLTPPIERGEKEKDYSIVYAKLNNNHNIASMSPKLYIFRNRAFHHKGNG